MTHAITFVIEKLDDGSFKNTKAYHNHLNSLAAGRWSIVVKKYRKSRSLRQNGLLHAYLTIIADDTGNNMQIVKDILKKEFLTTELLDGNGEIICNPKTGEPLTYVKDTSDLNTLEMSTFIEQIRIWAMDFNIYLPLPEEQTKFQY